MTLKLSAILMGWVAFLVVMEPVCRGVAAVMTGEVVLDGRSPFGGRAGVPSGLSPYGSQTEPHIAIAGER